MLRWVIPTPAPCANRYSAWASAGRRKRPETKPSPTGIFSGCGSGGSGLGLRVPASGQHAGNPDVGREVDLAPFLARDVERPHLRRLGDVVAHPEVPNGWALAGV